MNDQKLEAANALKKKIDTAASLMNYLVKSTCRVGGKAEVKVTADTHDSEIFYLSDEFVTPIYDALKNLENNWKVEFDAL